MVLQNNGGDSLTTTSNGVFTFSTPVAQGATYSVTVLAQPSTQTCTVTNGSGTMGGSNVTNVGVSCLDNTATLTTTASLALSQTGYTEYGVVGTPTSGLPRSITVNNIGADSAINLSISYPTWPSGTTASTNCGSSLLSGDSCTITVTPGNTATSDGTSPCTTAATMPIAQNITISAANASSVSSSIVILGYGCIYQNGYVYAFDDTTASTGSVGGKAATTSNQAEPFPNGIVWDAAAPSCTSNPTMCYVTNANSDSNGTNVPGGNTYLIYQTLTTTHGESATSYAAGLCTATISSYSDWYLPAICEMGYATSVDVDCGSQSTPVLQNMQSALVEFNNLNLLSGLYWSSMESTANSKYAWLQFFSSSSSTQFPAEKFQLVGARCSRIF